MDAVVYNRIASPSHTHTLFSSSPATTPQRFDVEDVFLAASDDGSEYSDDEGEGEGEEGEEGSNDGDGHGDDGGDDGDDGDDGGAASGDDAGEA